MAKRRTPWNIGNGREGGKDLRAVILALLREYPGITAKELQHMAVASKSAVLKHLAAIRKEWRDELRRLDNDE